MLLQDILKDHINSLYMQTRDAGVAPQTDYQGIPVVIEQEPGSIREGVSEQGKPWKTTFHYAYGYIQRTNGADGEEIDCFIGPNPYASNVYVIHQNVGGEYDEDKCMLGFDSEEAARDAFLAHYNTQDHLGPITAMSLVEFKQWLGLNINIG